MRSLTFKRFAEAADFGFDREEDERDAAERPTEPIDTFDVGLMMDFLAGKSVGGAKGELVFPNVMQWGDRPGSVRLDVDPGYRVSVRRLAIDRLGGARWITKKLFQLNRTGRGGSEDGVAQDLIGLLEKAASGGLESPTQDFELEPLVENIYGRLKRTSKNIFFPEGVRKLHDDCFILSFGVVGQGLGAMGHQRIEQNQILVTYDRQQGTVRILDQNLLSGVGGEHKFRIGLPNFEHYFFPSQGDDEISDTIVTFMKYY